MVNLNHESAGKFPADPKLRVEQNIREGKGVKF